MSKKRKKKNCQIKKTKSNNKKIKKVLDGVDLIDKEKIVDNTKLCKKQQNTDNKINFNINNDTSDELNSNDVIKKRNNYLNLNEHIQSIVSILFTIIIFIALILLISVLYNNYLKKDDDSCNTLEVCQEYIKKDYEISNESVNKFIRDTRVIIYNISSFNINSYDNDKLLLLATYFIWGSDSEYLVCDIEIDSNCLATKKEMEFNSLKKYFKKYLNISDLNIKFKDNFTNDDKIRLYLQDKNVILTFKEFEYETPKHDIVDIKVDEDEVDVIFAISRKIDNYYAYIGYKKLKLRYIENNFVIEEIVTNLNS